MKTRLQLYVIAYIVKFGLTSAQPHDYVVGQEDTDKINDGSGVEGNFRNLFDSIAKDNGKSSDVLRGMLKDEVERERHGFDVVREKLRIARSKSTSGQRNVDSESGRGTVVASKREVSGSDGGSGNKSVVASQREVTVGDDDGDRQPTRMERFKKALNKARSIVVITGAGINVDSGIPLVRGDNLYYKNREVRIIKHSSTITKAPSLLWEYVNNERNNVLSRKPNAAHWALAEFERRCQKEGRNFTLITQNADGLQRKAGSKNLIELFGSIFRTKCTVCGDVDVNVNNPVCPALGARAHRANATRFYHLPPEHLPRCEKMQCGGLLVPDIVLHGDEIDPKLVIQADKAMRASDFCIIIGSSQLVYPTNEYATEYVWRKFPVAEFNIDTTCQTSIFQYFFQGPSSKTVPDALLS